MGNTMTAGDGNDRPGPIFVSAGAVRALIDWSDAIDCLKRAYSAPENPEASPPRVVARGDGLALRALISVPPFGRFMGAKVFGRGRNRGVEYTIVLIEKETGQVAGFVDGNLVTALRTAATSSLAVAELTPPDRPLVVGVLGSGLEARSHIAAIAAIRPIREVRVFSPTKDNRNAFASDVGSDLSVACLPVESGEQAAAGADLIIAASRSKDESPILLGSWLTPGMTVVSVGSTLPEQREADIDAIRICSPILCDVPEEVSQHSGDMIAAREAGVAVEDKLISLNAVLAEDTTFARDPNAIVMFKSVGSALQDIVIAELAYDRAVAQDRATQLPIQFLTKT